MSLLLTWSEESVVHPKYRTVPHGSPDDPVAALVLTELLQSCQRLLVRVELSRGRVDPGGGTPGAVLAVAQHGPAQPHLAHPAVLLPGGEAGAAHHHVGPEGLLGDLAGDVLGQAGGEGGQGGGRGHHVGRHVGVGGDTAGQEGPRVGPGVLWPGLPGTLITPANV